MAKDSGTITVLIHRLKDGDNSVMKDLAAGVYEHLKKIAGRQLRGRQDHTFTPTALVNEAFLQLMEKEKLGVENRTHFYALAAQCMRWILMDYAKAKRQQKRGGGQLRVTFNEENVVGSDGGFDLVELNDLLSKLAQENERLYRVVELRYLGGLSIEETATVLGVSPTTVKRDWEVAKAWLARELTRSAA